MALPLYDNWSAGIEHEFKIADLLERYVPDRQARDRVLVDNPARFFGFTLTG